jgi:4-amino-4-deoxy-L-arabinose transferase-like glycosyltransferase
MDSVGAASRTTFARAWDSAFRPGEWLLSKFCHLDKAQWPILWVVAFFLVQAVPVTIVRSSNLEEGTIIAIARGAVEDGHWLTPFIYGDRFAERPVLLSWISALVGEATGSVTLWTLRVPHLSFFLAGALLIYSLLRSVTGKSAAIFGALCWISTPVVAPKFINSEPDIVLSTLLFAAFCVWWQGTIGKSMTPWRWLCVGGLIGLAGLTKGPQPVAYFALGVGAYLLLKQRDQIPAFVVANLVAGLIIGGWYTMVRQPNDIQLWMAHSRLSNTTTGLQTVRDHLDFIKSLALEFLPGTILIGPATMVVAQTWRRGGHDLMLAALLYCMMCTLVLVFWPGGVAARYAMPATMTLAVICGLMFEQLRQSRPRVIASALFVTYLIFGALLIRGWVAMPFWPHLFEESQRAGNAIASALQGGPRPLYVIRGSTDLNMLVYVSGPIRAVSLGDLAKLETPAMAVMLPEEEAALTQQNPRMRLIDHAAVSQRRPFRIVEIHPPHELPEATKEVAN